jgi:hypothetical protein
LVPDFSQKDQSGFGPRHLSIAELLEVDLVKRFSVKTELFASIDADENGVGGFGDADLHNIREQKGSGGRSRRDAAGPAGDWSPVWLIPPQSDRG